VLGANRNCKLYSRRQEAINVTGTIRRERDSLDNALHVNGYHYPVNSLGGARAYSGAGGIRLAGDDAGGNRFCRTAWSDGAK